MQRTSPSSTGADEIAAGSPDTARSAAVRRHGAMALMYHALSDARSARGAGIDPVQFADARYTVDFDVFGRQLARIALDAGGAGSARDWLDGTDRRGVLLTFDDGHASNRRLAFPLLLEHGMRADFFVNPATVGSPGYMDWPDLRHMAAAGMSIQSHGYDHRYLTHLAPHELRESLRAARIEIEDRVGTAVRLLAPPGGRMPVGLRTVAAACGYSHVLGSRPGRIRAKETGVLPRFAMTSAMTEWDVSRWIRGGLRSTLGQSVRYATLCLAKRALGDRLYEQARARALSIPRRGT